MFKLTKVGIAATLGLALCLSLFTSGAFAQSIQQNGAARTAVTAQQTLQNAWNGGSPRNRVPGNGWGGNHFPGNGWQSNGWCGLHTGAGCPSHGKCGLRTSCAGHGKHAKCVRTTKLVRFWHYTRRVSFQVCHR